ncbi:MAG: GGDEF domain-containing protein [Lachnospiraceae bacterium]|nr:GGDEF domain-containing protein [Lachnospiraceae bacterium]
MKKEEYKKIKGIRVLYVSGGILLIACLLFALTCYGVDRVSSRYYELNDVVDMYLLSEQEIRDLEKTSDFLTDQARRFAATMDRQYMDAYFEKRNEAYCPEEMIEEIAERQRQGSDIDAGYLKKMLSRSDQLMQSEIHSMKLIAVTQGFEELPSEVEEYELPQWELWADKSQQLERANSLVYNQAYINIKSRTDARFETALGSITNEAKKRERESSEVLNHALRQQRASIFLLFTFIVIIFVLIIILVLNPIAHFVMRIKDEQPLEMIGSYELKYLADTYNRMYEINTASKAILQHQAEHDALTDLLNRQAFEQLKCYLSTIKKPLALLIVDLDYFKTINDANGHMVGDQALKRLAELLLDGFRTNDYLIWVGGDEFVVVMLDVTEEEKEIIAHKIDAINKSLSQPADGLPAMSVSVGAAFSSEGYYRELYEHADSALYRTKENGRCGCSFYDERIDGSDGT